jgi:hypothetical protein
MPPHRGPRIPLDQDVLDRGLARLVPNARDRTFLLRCVLEEGPAHHRVANHALLRLLLDVVEATDAVLAPTAGVSVPMRVPPHLRDPGVEQTFPLALDVAPLRRLGADPAPWVEALVDGPPHHALANVLMVNLLGAVLAHLERR